MLSICIWSRYTLYVLSRLPYRLTNIRRANLFSSCWFSLHTDELAENEADLADYGVSLIRDYSDVFSMPDGVHTTMRVKTPKRAYLCNNPCSHTHQQDAAGVCVSRTFSRVGASSDDVLDTTVTSVLELPTAPPPMGNLSPSLRFIQDGTMSLPMKRSLRAPTTSSPGVASSAPDSKKQTEPKSPVVIMSRWVNVDSSPPCKQKRRVDDCISEFTSLSVQQHQHQFRKTRNSKSLSEAYFSTKPAMPITTSPAASFNPRTKLPLQSSPVGVWAVGLRPHFWLVSRSIARSVCKMRSQPFCRGLMPQRGLGIKHVGFDTGTHFWHAPAGIPFIPLHCSFFRLCFRCQRDASIQRVLISTIHWYLKLPPNGKAGQLVKLKEVCALNGLFHSFLSLQAINFELNFTGQKGGPCPSITKQFKGLPHSGFFAPYIPCSVILLRCPFSPLHRQNCVRCLRSVA